MKIIHFVIIHFSKDAHGRWIDILKVCVDAVYRTPETLYAAVNVKVTVTVDKVKSKKS